MVGNVRSLALSLLAAGLVAGVASGCGSDGSDGAVALDPSATTPSSSESPSESPSSTPAASPSASTLPDWPSCAEVWVADADLPKPYDGCLEGDVAVEAQALKCSAGVELVTYDDHFWGVPGHRISAAQGALRGDPEFRRTRATCTA